MKRGGEGIKVKKRKTKKFCMFIRCKSWPLLDEVEEGGERSREREERVRVLSKSTGRNN